MNNRFVLPMLAVVATVVAFGAVSVSAHDDTAKSSIVQKLAQKFNLSEPDIQAVFDEERAEHMKVMEEKIAERLSQAVTDGKITEEQKQKIIVKQQELRAAHESMRGQLHNSGSEERREAMKKEHEELKQWAQDNGIDIQYLMPVAHKFEESGHGGIKGHEGSKHFVIHEE